MATYYSNIYHSAKVRNACEASEGLVTIRGRVEVPVGKAPATGDTLKLFINPAGCTVLRLVLAHNIWGTTCPIAEIGDETDPNAIQDTDIVLTAIRGYGGTIPLQLWNDGADTGGVLQFDADMPPRTGDEDIIATLGTVSGAVTTGAWLSFTAELYVPDNRTTFGGGTVYTWNGTSAGLGNAST